LGKKNKKEKQTYYFRLLEDALPALVCGAAHEARFLHANA